MYYRSGCSLLAFLLGVAVAISTVTAETDVSSSELVDSTEGEHRGLRGSFGWSPRIINGDIVTDPSKYPYYALMTIRSVNGASARCGGALIGPKFVLTAAHCVSPDATDTFDIGVIRAGGVSSSLSSFSKPSGTSYGVKERKMHPGYDENTVINDIAVYELDRPVTGVQYIKLGKTPVSEDGKDLTVIGMGATQSGGPGSDRLRKTTVDYMPNSVCTDKMPLFSSYNANDGDLCAYRKNTDSCQGDSGGPLLIETGSASTHELVGVVSWGYGCAEATPGVYARVSYYYDWIVETMCSMNAKAVPTEYSCSVGPSAPPIDNDDTSGIGTIEPTTFSSFEGFEDEDSEFYTSIWEEIARWFGF